MNENEGHIIRDTTKSTLLRTVPVYIKSILEQLEHSLFLSKVSQKV